MLNNTLIPYLHLDGRYGDVPHYPEIAAVVQMLVLKTDKVPHKPPDGKCKTFKNQAWFLKPENRT